MNPLLEITRTQIMERKAFGESAFPDEQILKAIEIYDLEGSSKRRAQSFISMLTPLWKTYEKADYVPLFEKFIELEAGLESVSPKHSSHVNHVIQEFLLGYNFLLNSEFVRKQHNFDVGRQNPDSDFGKLFFSWMAASLLHDIGYDVEEAPEEEAFRKNKNDFWDFMTGRALTTEPLTFSDKGPGRRIIETHLLEEIKKIPDSPQLTYTEFESLFRRDVPNSEKWVRYDHGVISALKYLVELEKLENEKGGNYLNWPPNKHAALAMALHNFRFKDCDLKLTCTNMQTFIAYLLIICDEIQEWERERSDSDTELPNRISQGVNAKKRTELAGISFGSTRAFIIVNHRLKDPSLKEKFEKYLDEKIILQKKHYPITVMFSDKNTNFKKELFESFLKMPPLVLTALNATPYTGLKYSWKLSKELIEAKTSEGLVEIANDFLTKIDVSKTRSQRLKKIANTKNTKNLLTPSNPPLYNIYVNHMVDGEPYLTTVFPF